MEKDERDIKEFTEINKLIRNNVKETKKEILLLKLRFIEEDKEVKF